MSVDIAAAFNAGSDARLAGAPLTDNPYLGIGDAAKLSRAWANGWHDVATYWGRISRRPVRKLQPVLHAQRQ